jgi:hypothetical protein
LNSLSLNVKRLLLFFLFGFGVNGTVDPDGILELILLWSAVMLELMMAVYSLLLHPLWTRLSTSTRDRRRDQIQSGKDGEREGYKGS